MAGSVLFRHFAIRTHNVEKARKFYEQGLGLRFVDYRPGTREAMDLSDGTVNLTLIQYDGLTRTALEEGSEFIHLGFLVEDLAATYQRFLAIGAAVVREDVKERYAHDDATVVPKGSFKVLDIDGNVLDITERPDEWRA
jgi:catechol 2,3-dioxygenase-like lactoylglutathione lyase family enzyme